MMRHWMKISALLFFLLACWAANGQVKEGNTAPKVEKSEKAAKKSDAPKADSKKNGGGKLTDASNEKTLPGRTIDVCKLSGDKGPSCVLL